MPQSLIEAMARGKIVVSSKTQGGKEIISNGKNGFLFEISNSKQLEKILKHINRMSEKEKIVMREYARKSVEKFKWSKLIKSWEIIFNENINR